jgi:hypothetical protein
MLVDQLVEELPFPHAGLQLEARPDVEWLVVERLGADVAVAEALVAGAAVAARAAP